MSAWLRRRPTADIFTRIDCSEERKIEVNGPCFDARMPLMTLTGGCLVEVLAVVFVRIGRTNMFDYGTLKVFTGLLKLLLLDEYDRHCRPTKQSG